MLSSFKGEKKMKIDLFEVYLWEKGRENHQGETNLILRSWHRLNDPRIRILFSEYFLIW